ncbi:MAG TPA: c-type cytochrome [Burkholderiales bacterium]|nr:c-type cytochrome [Burkholderiales bacterium]
MKSRAAILLFTLVFGASLAAPAAGPNAARELAANCANCHGTDGRSAGVMPSLVGLDRGYFVRQMQDFKAGRRPATIMHQLAKGYTDEQVELMAGYFAGQK